LYFDSSVADVVKWFYSIPKLRRYESVIRSKQIDGRKLYNLCQPEHGHHNVFDEKHMKKIRRKANTIKQQKIEKKVQTRSILPSYSMHSEAMKSKYLYTVTEEGYEKLKKEWNEFLSLIPDLQNVINLAQNSTTRQAIEEEAQC